MYYRHNLPYQYPERSDDHMLKIKRVKEGKFDENYPYFPDGIGYCLMRGVYWCLINAIVFPLCRLIYGLRIHGKSELKKHRKLLKNGAITITSSPGLHSAFSETVSDAAAPQVM